MTFAALPPIAGSTPIRMPMNVDQMSRNGRLTPSATTVKPRLCAMSITARTMLAASPLVWASRTKLRSILSALSGRRVRYDRLEYPVPKSSTEILTPMVRRLRSMRTASAGFSTSELSVISSSISSAGVSLACSVRHTIASRSLRWNCWPTGSPPPAAGTSQQYVTERLAGKKKKKNELLWT